MFHLDENRRALRGLTMLLAILDRSSFSFFFQPYQQLDSQIKFSSLFAPVLPDGVTVAQQTLNLFVMVQIHVGQPIHLHFPTISSAFACETFS